MILARVEKWGDQKTAVKHKPYGEWISCSWAQFADRIDATAMNIGAVSVPIYTTNSARRTGN